MKIFAVDDEKIILDGLVEELKEVFPNDEICSFISAKKALDHLDKILKNGGSIEYAFLDIRMRGMTGIELAKLIKEKSPDTKILFCTAYSEYAYDAYQVFAVGYLLKPVDAKMITETLDKMNISWREEAAKKGSLVRVQTFGNFDVFVNGERVHFNRDKARELLAYLIDRNGTSVTTQEIAAVIFEDENYDTSLKNKTTAVISSLKKTLTSVGAEGILVKTWNHLAVDTSKLDCDVYAFLRGDLVAINSYHGEYMANYSWAEFTNASLTQTAMNAGGGWK